MVEQGYCRVLLAYEIMIEGLNSSDRVLSLEGRRINSLTPSDPPRPDHSIRLGEWRKLPIVRRKLKLMEEVSPSGKMEGDPSDWDLKDRETILRNREEAIKMCNASAKKTLNEPNRWQLLYCRI